MHEAIELFEFRDETLFSELEVEFRSLEQEIKIREHQMLFSKYGDISDALVTFTPGQGGIESQDWAEMLMHMIQSWAEKKSFDITCSDYEDGKTAGIKSATLEVKGSYAYGLLKAFSGVHRIMRFSPYDVDGQRQTSFASIFVAPLIEKENQEIILKPELLVRDTLRGSGKGGQNRNKVETVVRYTYDFTDENGKLHKVVSLCQDERSQKSNDDRAFRRLKNKIAAIIFQNEQEKHNQLEKTKKKNSWGSQIISYSFQPYTLVKDHRSNWNTTNIDQIMKGDLDAIMYAYLSMLL